MTYTPARLEHAHTLGPCSSPPALSSRCGHVCAGPRLPQGVCSHARGAQEATCHALVLWFDADFSARVCAAAPVRLSTSPLGEPTHWAQAVLALRHPVALGRAGAQQATEAPSAAHAPPDGQGPLCDAAGRGEPGPAGGGAALAGRLSVARGPTHRSLDISLELAASGGAPAQVMMYSVAMS